MPARILVVEDDVSLGENLCEILGLFGYAAVRVRSAEEAIDQVSALAVDLILTDGRLPQMSGTDLLARLRSQGRIIPAVLMSDWKANEDEDGEHPARGRVEIAFHPKPLDIAELLHSIARLLGGSGAYRLPESGAGAGARHG